MIVVCALRMVLCVFGVGVGGKTVGIPIMIRPCCGLEICCFT